MSGRARRTKPTHLARPYIIDVYRGGVVRVRHRSEPPEEGTLPVYSVDTADEGEMLQVRTCALSRENNQDYRLNPVYRGDRDLLELEDLDALTDTFARIHAEQRAAARRRRKAS